MTWGKNAATGETTITLSKEETARLEKRKPIVKITGCATGEYTLILKLTKTQERRKVGL